MSGRIADTSQKTYGRFDRFENLRPLKNGYSIDSFIDKKRRSAKISSAPRASPRELIRRAFYDLTGLPPTPPEVADFESSIQKQRSSRVE